MRSARRRAAWGAALSVVACAAFPGPAAGQWAVAPPRPTVGDTVWLAREVTLPEGWRVRPGKLDEGDAIGSLGDAAVLRTLGGWLIRYPVVAWTTGAHTIVLPPVWRLAPDGHADSLPGGTARFDVQSVIPESVTQPQPRPAIAPLRPDRRHPGMLLLAIAASAALLAGAIAWRRRAGRPAAPSPQVPVERDVPDERWLAAGEPKAVAARAARQLRTAIARAHPDASVALSTTECLAALKHKVPDIPLRQLAEVLTQLERVGFASAQGAEAAVLAERARALARELVP